MTNGKRMIGRGVAAVAALAVMLALAPGSADAKVERHLGLEQQPNSTSAGDNAPKGQKGAKAAAKFGLVLGTVVTRGGKVVRCSKVVVTRISGRHVVHRMRTGPGGHFQ